MTKEIELLPMEKFETEEELRRYWKNFATDLKNNDFEESYFRKRGL